MEEQEQKPETYVVTEFLTEDHFRETVLESTPNSEGFECLFEEHELRIPREIRARLDRLDRIHRAEIELDIPKGKSELKEKLLNYSSVLHSRLREEAVKLWCRLQEMGFANTIIGSIDAINFDGTNHETEQSILKEILNTQEKRESFESKVADLRERLKSAQERCPELLAEFERRKEERKAAGKYGWNWHMFMLQRDILFGPEWEWPDWPFEIEGYSEDELKTIDQLACKFFKARENELRGGCCKVGPWDALLMKELQEVGINTTGKEDAIFEQAFGKLHKKTHAGFIAWGNYTDEDEAMPEELQYYYY